MTKAEPLAQRVVLLSEQQYGAQHFEVAVPLNNLAAMHSQMGQFAKAEQEMERAILILAAKFGPNYASVAPPLTNLASATDIHEGF